MTRERSLLSPNRFVPRAMALPASAVLAALAVVLQVVQPAATTAQTRGSFASLPAAEAALEKGDAARGLDLLVVNVTRATYEGLPGVAERIRRRTALAGVAILEGKLAIASAQGADPDQAAWPFFETAALLAADFDASAIPAESLYLQRLGNQIHRFVYRMTRGDGVTVWGDRPDTDWTAIWPLLHRWNAISGRKNLGGIYTEQTLEWPKRTFATLWKCELKGPRRPAPFTIITAGVRRGDKVWFGAPVRLAPGQPGSEESWSFESDPLKGSPFPTRLLLFADEIPTPSAVTLTLVHEYKAL